MIRILLWLLLSTAALAQIPSPVTRFRAKFGLLPLHTHLTWRAVIWGEEGTS